jgi:hypothetical protein
VTKKRHDFTKPEREYVKGIVHNLSFQRLTDQEIVQWLHDEKKIDIDRSTVSKMRSQVESKAEKWYIELKQSTFKYIAVYKERIDSLFSYQKKLHEIISVTKKPEVQLRAISELHSIEMSIFSLWKQLPDLRIEDANVESGISQTNRPVAICHCIGDLTCHFQCRKCHHAWCPENKEKIQEVCPRCSHRIEKIEGIEGSEFEPWDMNTWLNCPLCGRWFKTKEILDEHKCLPEPIV